MAGVESAAAFAAGLRQHLDWPLLALRLALGPVFLAHGLPKVRNPAAVVGPQGGAGAARFFRFLGICESLGGLALLTGFLTQPAALGLSLMLIGAIPINIFTLKAPFESHAPQIGGLGLPLAPPPPPLPLLLSRARRPPLWP